MNVGELFPQVFQRIRWQDTLDLFLVFVIVYRLLLLIRGTRAVQVLTGLGILAVMYVLSDRMSLFALNYLLRLFFEYLFIIMIILFQDDIRRALARMGRNPFLLSNNEKSRAVQVLEEITRAAALLAAKRTGALIVLERQHGLKNFTEGATVLNAEVSAELLVSIFHTDSPIHDGAVVVQGDKVLAAGVFFPVDLDPKMDRNFGTRHRAALTLTQETDALVIVVSEERGEISLLEGGRITRDAGEDVLRQRLFAAFELLQQLPPEVPRGA